MIKRTKYNRQYPMEVPLDEKEYNLALDEWSEGNKSLRNCLDFMNKNGYTTFVSCGGHEDRKMEPYIGFLLKDKKEENSLYYFLANKLLKIGYKIKVSNYDINQKYYKRLIIYIPISDKYTGFEYITDLTKDFLEKEKNIEDGYVKNILDFFLKYGNKYYLDINIGFMKNKIELYKYDEEEFITLDNNKNVIKKSSNEETEDYKEGDKYIFKKTGRTISNYIIDIKDINYILISKKKNRNDNW